MSRPVNPDRPNDKYDYTVNRRNQSRNERRKWFKELFGLGMDGFIGLVANFSEDDLIVLKQLIEKYKKGKQ